MPDTSEADALAAVIATEPDTIDPTYFARVGGEMVPVYVPAAESAVESPRLSTLQQIGGDDA